MHTGFFDLINRSGEGGAFVIVSFMGKVCLIVVFGAMLLSEMSCGESCGEFDWRRRRRRLYGGK